MGKMSTMAKSKKYDPEDASLKNILEEPSEPYYTSNNFLSPWRLLYNNKQEPSSSFQYVENAMDGVPKSSAINLANTMDIPLKDMAFLLNISYKTFARKKSGDKMDALTSSLTIEIANVIAEGITTFGSLQKFRNWLQKPNRALSGHSPFSLLSTPTGIKMVQNVLGRINEGIYT